VPLRHKEGLTNFAAFNANGTRVVTASSENTAQVWDVQTGQPVGAPLQHPKSVTSAQFSPDATRVVTASLDDTAQVWDSLTGQPIGAPLRHANYVSLARFSPDGTRIVTSSADGTVRVWDVAAGASSEAGLIVEAAEAQSGYHVTDAGSLVRVEDAAARLMSLQEKVATAKLGEPTAASLIQWVFEDSWNRTISPISGITVNDYIVERLKLCTDEARSEAESFFLGHPRFRQAQEFCPAFQKPTPPAPHAAGQSSR